MLPNSRLIDELTYPLMEESPCEIRTFQLFQNNHHDFGKEILHDVIFKFEQLHQSLNVLCLLFLVVESKCICQLRYQMKLIQQLKGGEEVCLRQILCYLFLLIPMLFKEIKYMLVGPL